MIERIAGKDYTTLTNIEKMRELCRVEAREQGSGLNRRDGTPTGDSSDAPFSSSGTDHASAALVSAKVKLNKLSGR